MHRDVRFEDELLLIIVECDRTTANLRWIESYKNDVLLGEFRQVEIYLAVTEILWLEKRGNLLLAFEVALLRHRNLARLAGGPGDALRDDLQKRRICEYLVVVAESAVEHAPLAHVDGP